VRGAGSRRPAAGGRLLAGALLGFGIWQFVDVVVFHWIVGIHRIRVDVPEPLPWDIGWMAVFGAPAVAAGLWILRKTDRDGPPGDGRAGAAVLAAIVVVAGPVAALPPPGVSTTTVLFRPGLGPAGAFEAVAAVGGRIAWTDPSGEIVVMETGPETRTRALYAKGALLVGGPLVAAGCLAWTRAAAL
jgi:hypothetical protein